MNRGEVLLIELPLPTKMFSGCFSDLNHHRLGMSDHSISFDLPVYCLIICIFDRAFLYLII